MAELLELSGRVENVFTERLGSFLTADALAGATSIQIDDTSDFDAEDGGTLSLAGTQYGYTLDEATGIATLDAGLVADASAGDAVYAWDDVTDAIAIQTRASIATPGVDAVGEFITADVPDSLRLPEGIRTPKARESVTIRQRGDDWLITDGPTAGATVSKEWSAKGTVSSESGTHALYNDTGHTLYLIKVRVAFTAGNGPTGGDFTVQVQRNGSDILSTPVTVADGELTATGVPDLITTWPDGTYLTVVITSTAPGTDPVVTVVTQ